jgi:demethylmenaquinone methyltransferase / 2-methoxy-6-polyprenyl-1,4-benzoquinol methylase
MANTVKPYPNSIGKKEQVAEMFDKIAPKYDFLNQLLSLGIHKRWRRKSVELLIPSNPKIILDVATGTGDFAIEANRILCPTKIIGVDISEGMLAIGREKIKKTRLDQFIELKTGDSENLSFVDNTFDAITVGFGVRNFETLEKGMAGMFRVLKPGGTLVVLEFSHPKKFPIKQFYDFYFKNITPAIGRVFSKDSRAYSYLPESVMAFPDGERFVEILKKTGFSQTSWQPLSFGIASIYTGKKQELQSQ